MLRKFLLFICILAASSVFGQSKFGVVDFQNILESLSEYNLVKLQLQETSNRYNEEYKKMSEDIDRKFEDYQTGISRDIAAGTETKLTLPKSNVLAFFLEDGAKAIVRPSGTEPKIKTYFTAKAPTHEECVELEAKLAADFTKVMK